jgi:pimeloyl-ACP methyl ester carboxylesterase
MQIRFLRLTAWRDLVDTLSLLHCPLLAVRGEYDSPASTAPMFDAIRRGLVEAGNQDFSLRVLPRANHDLFETRGGRVDDLAFARGLAPDFAPDVMDWILRHAGVSPTLPR